MGAEAVSTARARWYRHCSYDRGYLQKETLTNRRNDRRRRTMKGFSKRFRRVPVTARATVATAAVIAAAGLAQHTSVLHATQPAPSDTTRRSAPVSPVVSPANPSVSPLDELNEAF